MFKLDKVLYTARTHTSGGREIGMSRSSDGHLDILLVSPGTSDTGTNPEQLFAAGWSACLISSIKIVAHRMNIRLPEDVSIDAEVDLGATGNGYGLAVRFSVSLPGIEREVAELLIEAADKLCPYSAATRDNIDVTIDLIEPDLSWERSSTYTAARSGAATA